ncbi:MAG: substrate-binding domain-containing protein [Pseudomonadota bacterium]
MRLVLVGVGLMLTLTAQAGEKFITLASTTSTQASGFFDYYLPLFQSRTGIEVRVVAVGTGQALKLGENGDADVLLVHDKTGELKFVEEGHGIDRREVMYNDFVIIGPKSDPAKVAGFINSLLALQSIAGNKQSFISRGDDSGTHRLESRLWREAGIDPNAAGNSWYKEAGAGMGAVLNMAAVTSGYTISDRATWLSFHNRRRLALLHEGDPRLFNQYSLILVNPEKHGHVKKQGALIFMDWMTSPEGQRAIADFQIGGEILFKPNAQLKEVTPGISEDNRR